MFLFIYTVLKLLNAQSVNALMKTTKKMERRVATVRVSACNAMKLQNNVAVFQEKETFFSLDGCNLQCFDAIYYKQIITNQIKSNINSISTRYSKHKTLAACYRSWMNSTNRFWHKSVKHKNDWTFFFLRSQMFTINKL